MMSGSAPHIPVGRFAPSPTGRMHAGNIYAALVSWLTVKSQSGRIVLRIEDLDKDRSKQEFIRQIPRDFELLGLFWDEGPFYQADRDPVYAEYFHNLEEQDAVYPCFCTRADLLAASAPHRGEKTVYAGTCRSLTKSEAQKAAESRKPAFRLMVPDATYSFEDGFQGQYTQNLATDCGDFIIRRSDGAFAYQLAVVVDDALQGVNTVVRGVDLLCSSPQQLYLQDCFGFEHPRYYHLPLLTGAPGVRLSKRNRDAGLEEMLRTFGSPRQLIGWLAFLVGIIDRPEGCTPEELLSAFDAEKLRQQWQGVIEIPWHLPV